MILSALMGRDGVSVVAGPAGVAGMLALTSSCSKVAMVSMSIVKSFLETVKRMLFLGFILLRYVLIYNLEVSFNFHLTFLQLNVIKMFTVQ